MKTNKLIENLASNLAPIKSADSLPLFLTKTIGVMLSISLITFQVIGVRNDFSYQLRDVAFALESMLWILTSVLAAITAYQYSIPGLSPRIFTILTIISALLLCLIIPWGSTSPSLDLHTELLLQKGICGGIIAVLSSLAALYFFNWARKAAPTSSGAAGFWILLSTSSFGSAVMQLFCAHDSAIHLYLWHVIPTMLLTLLGFQLGKKLLRW